MDRRARRIAIRIKATLDGTPKIETAARRHLLRLAHGFWLDLDSEPPHVDYFAFMEACGARPEETLRALDHTKHAA